MQVANFQSLPISHFSRTSSEAQVNLAIPLDLYRLQLIEAQRVGDVMLRFDFTFQYAKHYPIPRKQANSPIERFESNFIQFTASVPQSHWVTKVLPGLGYGKISLVEVPTPESAFGETLNRVVAEFERAQTYLLLGDYNKALGHCRNALEALSNAVEYKGTPKNGGGIPPLTTRSITCSMCFREVRQDFDERTWRVCAKICMALPAHQSIPRRRTLRGTTPR